MGSGRALNAPLDALVVHKLGAPGNPEFAFGTLSTGGRVVLADDVVRALRLTPEQVRAVAGAEAAELARREAAYRGGRGPLDVAGRTVILVDDGLATGASMFAAIDARRRPTASRRAHRGTQQTVFVGNGFGALPSSFAGHSTDATSRSGVTASTGR